MLAAAVMGLAVLSAGPGVARAAPVSTDAGVTFVSQSPYINHRGLFQIHIDLPRGVPSADVVQILTFQRLDNRTNFDSALNGQYNGYAIYDPTVPVQQLNADPHGGFDLDIPVDKSPTAGNPLPSFPGLGQSGIYPLQVGLYDASSHLVGQPIDTFLVYAAGGDKPLPVAVILPVTSPPVIGPKGQVEPLGSAESSRISDLVSALSSRSGVHFNLDTIPQMLDALTAGSSTDQRSASVLRELVTGRTAEVFPSTYVRVSISELLGAALDGELADQLQAGDAAFQRVLGVTPPSTTWLVNGPLDQPTLSAMVGRGASQLVVPGADLTPLPASSTSFGTTFARGAQLTTAAGSNLAVFGADTGLTADFDRVTNPVLAANQLLAEMAMIQLELPSNQRGVVAMSPSGWTPSPQFVTTLLDGLAGNPLLSSVAVSKLFTNALLNPPVTRQIAPFQPAGRDQADGTLVSGEILQAKGQITGVSSILDSSRSTVSALQSELLVMESSDVTDAQRQAFLQSVSDSAAQLLHEIRVPGPSSITLTSTRSRLPVTILTTSPSLKAHVRLELSSPRLIFESYNPPNGKCQTAGPTVEICSLLLVIQNTTLKIPVEARSLGVFTLTVTMSPPDGSVAFPTVKDTVRSTAVSGVGIVLIVVTLLSLGIWWVRDLRRGRRARRLIPSPVSDPEDETLTADPVVNAFFSVPPPDLNRGRRPRPPGPPPPAPPER